MFFFAFPFGGVAQTQKAEDIIYLKYADLAQQLEIGGLFYQRVSGNVRFLHNNTYILCDTAIWDKTNGILDAKGNIQIIQDQTKLTGETLHYIEATNMAQLRGRRVELSDNKNNRLRTQSLDFNTKDSIGTFFAGGSMIDSAGNILESVVGHYYSKEKLFVFERTVEMSTDTVLIKADTIHYKTDENVATLFGNIHTWHTDGYLRANRGRYERENEYFHFSRSVYLQSEHQEIWADTLNYDRNTGSGTLFGNIQVLDTTQSIILLGDEGHFRNEPQRVLFTRNPVFITYSEDEENVIDTLFFRGDTLLLVTLPKYEVDHAEIAAANTRLRYLTQPLSPSDTLPKVEAVVPSALRARPSVPDSLARDTIPHIRDSIPHIRDSILHTLDSIPPPPLLDTLSIPPPTDSLPPQDSTSIRFISAWKNVRMYRNNGQGVCDSLVYNSLDSTARLYKEPVLWNEKNQFSADSIQFFFQNNQISRADLFSSAFIISQEDDPMLYNQIKGKDMIGYFRENDIYRFDVKGAVEAIFCIREDNLITSLNKKESDELYVTIKDREVQRLSYWKNISSVVYPLYSMTDSDQRLVNFKWRVEERPKDRFDITSRTILPSAVNQVTDVSQPTFSYTVQYFPDHPLPEVKKRVKDTLPTQQDTLLNLPPKQIEADSLIRSVQIDSLQRATSDSLKIVSPVEQIVIKNIDSLAVKKTEALPVDAQERVTETIEGMPTPTKKELRAQRKALKREKAAIRKEERRQRREQRLLRKKMG